jgi:hypothetical protein
MSEDQEVNELETAQQERDVLCCQAKAILGNCMWIENTQHSVYSVNEGR